MRRQRREKIQKMLMKKGFAPYISTSRIGFRDGQVTQPYNASRTREDNGYIFPFLSMTTKHYSQNSSQERTLMILQYITALGVRQSTSSVLTEQKQAIQDRFKKNHQHSHDSKLDTVYGMIIDTTDTNNIPALRACKNALQYANPRQYPALLFTVSEKGLQGPFRTSALDQMIADSRKNFFNPSYQN